MKLLERIKNLFRPEGKISDGYHTFDELYQYRMLYNAGFFNMLAALPGNPYNVHKSVRHNNGDLCFGGGWFIVMATLPTGQISNHYELCNWNLFHVCERMVADKWDGHTSENVANRLWNLFNYPSRLSALWKNQILSYFEKH